MVVTDGTFKDEENQMAEDEAENSGSNKIVFSFLQDSSFCYYRDLTIDILLSLHISMIQKK